MGVQRGGVTRRYHGPQHSNLSILGYDLVVIGRRDHTIQFLWPLFDHARFLYRRVVAL
jgi:hypothetical protein